MNLSDCYIELPYSKNGTRFFFRFYVPGILTILNDGSAKKVPSVNVFDLLDSNGSISLDNLEPVCDNIYKHIVELNQDYGDKITVDRLASGQLLLNYGDLQNTCYIKVMDYSKIKEYLEGKKENDYNEYNTFCIWYAFPLPDNLSDPDSVESLFKDSKRIDSFVNGQILPFGVPVVNEIRDFVLYENLKS